MANYTARHERPASQAREIDGKRYIAGPFSINRAMIRRVLKSGGSIRMVHRG